MRTSISRRAQLAAALAPAVATIVALIPLLITGTGDRPAIVLIVVFFVLAPLVALFVNWRFPQATTGSKTALVALLQPVVIILMLRFAVWYEYRDYYLEDSGEEAMSYGIGFIISLFLGVIMFLLVYTAGRVGTWLARR